MDNSQKIIKFRVQRFISDKDNKFFMVEYDLPVKKGLTVLEALMWIKENRDSSLSMRYSCRMGVCGSCGMYINGLPRLACQTQVLYLESDLIIVKPLPNFPVIRDLVTDLNGFFDKHRAVKPWIIRPDTTPDLPPKRELGQTPEELESYMQFSYCIKCGACVSACPTAATDREFLGPQALGQAQRYSADSRDAGIRERIKVLDLSHGIFNCHLGGACSEACPKGVDPALAIQLLKREVVLHSWRLKKPPEGAKEMTQYTKTLDKVIPTPPAPTVDK